MPAPDPPIDQLALTRPGWKRPWRRSVSQPAEELDEVAVSIESGELACPEVRFGDAVARHRVEHVCGGEFLVETIDIFAFDPTACGAGEE